MDNDYIRARAEAARVSLERQRLELDKNRFQTEPRRWWEKHLPLILSTVVSICSASASLFVSIRAIDSAAEIQKAQAIAQDAAQQVEWRIKAGTFVVEHELDLKSLDSKRHDFFLAEVRAIFPPAIAEDVLAPLPAIVPVMERAKYERAYRNAKADAQTAEAAAKSSPIVLREVPHTQVQPGQPPALTTMEDPRKKQAEAFSALSEKLRDEIFRGWFTAIHKKVGFVPRDHTSAAIVVMAALPLDELASHVVQAGPEGQVNIAFDQIVTRSNYTDFLLAVRSRLYLAYQSNWVQPELTSREEQGTWHQLANEEPGLAYVRAFLSLQIQLYWRLQKEGTQAHARADEIAADFNRNLHLRTHGAYNDFDFAPLTAGAIRALKISR